MKDPEVFSESNSTYIITKRVMDVVGACFGLLLVSPIIAVSSVAILLDDGPPILYRRRVLGVGLCEFDALKLRTMRVDADIWIEQHPDLLSKYLENVKLTDDPRVTKAGRILRKLSIDELPQLINVLRGEMSLVGPRMIHPSELPRFGEFGPERLSVRPGITGLWQISGRGKADYSVRLERDQRYLRERSLWLDIKILFSTIPSVLLGRGAH